MRQWLLPPVLLLFACSSSSQQPESLDGSSDGSTADASRDAPAADARTTDAPISDALADATCGTCPAEKPVCFHVNAHDGSHVMSAECIPMPTACASTPTCDCARSALAASWLPDSGVDAGLLVCPGPLYCDDAEGPLTIRCNPA